MLVVKPILQIGRMPGNGDSYVVCNGFFEKNKETV